MNVPPILSTKLLTKNYGKTCALDRLSLDIYPGEIFGLLGPNGSGKSTAIRLMLGFHRASSGSLEIAGFDPWRQSVEVRRRVAYLPGELRLYENLTGRKLVHFLLQLRQEKPDDRVEKLAKQFGIDLDIPLTEMSSGMKRKVALITVLTPQVPIIILDEPTNALDPVMRDELLNQLRLAQSEGKTILFSSHILSEVESICDRVGILRRGKLVHLQSIAELREGRKIEIDLPQLPQTGPDHLPFTGKRFPDGKIHFNFYGHADQLVAWLNQLGVLDVRIEPLGLIGIYQRFHGTVE